jgi:hypothetical protein
MPFALPTLGGVEFFGASRRFALEFGLKGEMKPKRGKPPALFKML